MTTLTAAEVREMLDWCLSTFGEDGLERFRQWLDLRGEVDGQPRPQ